MADKTPHQMLTSIAHEAYKAWDSDQDSRVGKILRALADPSFAQQYRADIESLHAALIAATPPRTSAGEKP